MACAAAVGLVRWSSDEPQLQGAYQQYQSVHLQSDGVCAARLEDVERHAGARVGPVQGDGGGGGYGVQEKGGGVHARVKDGFWGRRLREHFGRRK